MTDPTASASGLPEPVLEYAFEIRVDVDTDIHLGRGPHEVLAYTPITGGTVDGPLLRGVVLPGGGDWSVERDGTFQLEARYLLRAEDGSAIDILNRGYYRDEGDGEPYFRTAPVFQTDAPAHSWLSRNQFIGLARDEDEQICIRIYVVR